MPRVVYLGDRVDFSRTHTDPVPTDNRVIPGLQLVNPDAEPIQVNVIIPDYDDTFLPLREVHLQAFPTGTVLPPADELLNSPPEFHAAADVTNLKNTTTPLEIAGLPDGSWFVQSVLVAGSD